MTYSEFREGDVVGVVTYANGERRAKVVDNSDPGEVGVVFFDPFSRDTGFTPGSGVYDLSDIRRM